MGNNFIKSIVLSLILLTFCNCTEAMDIRKFVRENFNSDEDIHDKFTKIATARYIKGSKYIGKGCYFFVSLVPDGSSLDRKRPFFEEYQHVHDEYVAFKETYENIDGLIKFTQNYPDSEFVDEALLRLSELYEKNGNSDKAEKTLQKVIEDYGNSAFLDGGAFAYPFISPYLQPPVSMSEFPDSIYLGYESIYYLTYKSTHPNLSSDFARLQLARHLVEKNRVEDAFRVLENFAKDCPDGRWAQEDKKEKSENIGLWLKRIDENLYLFLIETCINAGKYQRAEELIRKCLDLYDYQREVWRFAKALIRIDKLSGNESRLADSMKILIDTLKRDVSEVRFNKYINDEYYPDMEFKHYSSQNCEAWQTIIDFFPRESINKPSDDGKILKN